LSIENIVRPAQLPDNQPAKTNSYRRTSRNWQPVIVRVQASGSPQFGSGSASQTVTYYHKRKPTEKSSSGDGTTNLGFSDALANQGFSWP
jgi:hypothetical protein